MCQDKTRNWCFILAGLAYGGQLTQQVATLSAKVNNAMHETEVKGDTTPRGRMGTGAVAAAAAAGCEASPAPGTRDTGSRRQRTPVRFMTSCSCCFLLLFCCFRYC